jgi:hypothetical protein
VDPALRPRLPQIDFVVQGQSLAQRWSDGGAPAPVIEVINRLPGESGEAAVKRAFAARTEKKLAVRCVMRQGDGAA